MKLGILETGQVPDQLADRHGDYPAMFAALLGAVDPTLTFATVSVVGGAALPDPGAADAWLVTGSRHGVYDDLPWIAPLKAFLRDCVRRGVPVVGVCFGHQILAEALGGAAEKSERGWMLGVEHYEVTRRLGWMSDLPDRFAAHAVHQDQVTRLPDDATVIARAPACSFAALVYGDPERPGAISVQPHPEFEAVYVGDLLTARAGVFPQDRAAIARASLGQPVDGAAWARLIVRFLETATAGRAAA